MENVQANEAVYKNIELQLEREFRLGDNMPNPEPFYVKKDVESSRFVAQDNLFYFRRDDSLSVVGGETQGQDVLEGFDGEKTRVVQQKAVANRFEGRKEDPRFFRPHTFLLKGAFVTFPLSDYLRGNAHTSGYRSYSDRSVEVEFAGLEVVDGLRCWKVRFKTWMKGTDPANGDMRYVWLASDRNYLPIRTEGYAPRVGGKLVEVGSVKGLKEISPGIWFPAEAEIVTYDETSLQRGQTIVSGTDRFRVTKVDLDPQYGIELFRNIPIPDGVAVYEVSGKVITRSYRQGGPPGRPFSPVPQSK